MTELEVNKLIHEKIMNLCWHEDCYSEHDEDGSCWIVCRKCWSRDISGFVNPSYTSSWADYGPMLEECMKKEWFDEFLNSGHGLYEEGDNSVGLQTICEIDVYYLNPLRGSTAIAEFLKERKKEEVC